MLGDDPIRSPNTRVIFFIAIFQTYLYVVFDVYLDMLIKFLCFGGFQVLDLMSSRLESYTRFYLKSVILASKKWMLLHPVVLDGMNSFALCYLIVFH